MKIRHILAATALLMHTATTAQNTNLSHRFKAHIDTLASDEYAGRKPQTKGDTLAVNYIIKELKKIGNIKMMGDDGLQVVTVPIKTRVPITNKKELKARAKAKKPAYNLKDETLHTFNVVARIDAPDSNNPNSEAIIIGAHYDHIGYRKNSKGDSVLVRGADDNASGVAFIIEYARSLSEMKNQLQRDVIFICFGAEEMGLLGSKYYAENPLDSLSKVVTMINFDMTGRMKNNGITIRGLASAYEAPALFSTFANPNDLDLIWEFRAKGPTDYRSFYDQGVPSFSFSTRIHSDYHTERDTIDKINFEGMDILFSYAGGVINHFALSKSRVTYRKSTR